MGLPTNALLALALLTAVAVGKEFCPDNCHCDMVNKVVNCRNAGLTRIPWELPDPAHLRQLDLRGNDIHEVLLETVSYLNLELLDLSHNRLVNIEDGVMSNMPHLKSLYLQNNNLGDLTEGTLSGLKHLQVLDLSQNQIKVMKDEVFSDMEALEELNLAGNGINQIREDAFAGLLNLRTLNLANNRLLGVPVEALKKTTQLTKLYLNENDLETVSTHSFRRLDYLRELYLQDNQISEISETAFFDHLKVDVSSLEVLSLSGNRIQKVPSASIHKLNSLISIDLSKNPIEVIDPDSFVGLNHVRRISLNSLPELKIVRKFAFSELERLQVVEMHSNRILKVIENDAFLATPSLSKVDLHANHLESMSATLLDWNALQEVDLRYNPWRCDCFLQWLPERLAKQHINSTKHLMTDVHCEMPVKLAGRQVYDTPPSEMVCPGKDDDHFEEHILIAIIASFSSVLFVVMLYLLCKHGYCSLKGKRVPRPANYYAHRHCNGHAAAHRGNSDEHVHIADNEQVPAENIMA